MILFEITIMVTQNSQKKSSKIVGKIYNDKQNLLLGRFF